MDLWRPWGTANNAFADSIEIEVENESKPMDIAKNAVCFYAALLRCLRDKRKSFI